MKHVRSLRTTLWCALLAQTTLTPSMHSPEKSSVRLVHHQNLIVHPHLPGSSHIHAYPSAVRHQLRILISTAASTVDLTPPRHPSAPTISKVAQVACQRVRSGAGSALLLRMAPNDCVRVLRLRIVACTSSFCASCACSFCTSRPLVNARKGVAGAPASWRAEHRALYATCTALSPFRRRRAAPARLRQRLTGYTRCRERLAPRTPPSYSSPSHSSVCAAPVSTLSVTAAARACRRTRLTPPGYMPCALPTGRSDRTTGLPPPGGRTCALGALGTLGSCLPAELRHGPGLGEHVPAAPAELLHVRERPRSGLGAAYAFGGVVHQSAV